MNSYLVQIVEADWDSAHLTPEQWAAARERHRLFREAVVAAGGEVLHFNALQASSRATRIDPAVDEHPAVFTDAPFAELKEVVSGYYAFTATDDETARTVAALCPSAGHLELFPILALA